MPLDLFSKTALPSTGPDDMRQIVNELRKTSGQEDCLKMAYAIMTGKYRGYRVKTYINLFEIFKKDLGYFWSRKGFLHCTNMNFVMRFLLVNSGFFEEGDLKLRWTLIWYISPHQYLQVKIGKKWIDVDIWANAYGIDLGSHAKGFR